MRNLLVYLKKKQYGEHLLTSFSAWLLVQMKSLSLSPRAV